MAVSRKIRRVAKHPPTWRPLLRGRYGWRTLTGERKRKQQETLKGPQVFKQERRTVRYCLGK
jgi:hypothetical protein